MIKQCSKCGSENLYLEPRVKGQDIMTANMVALKCKDCGSWLKWCPKDERQFYINKNQDNKVEECWVIQRDDGKFFDCFDIGGNEEFCDSFIRSIQDTIGFFKFNIPTKEMCEQAIKTHYLQNCRPVKVEIRVVGE